MVEPTTGALTVAAGAAIVKKTVDYLFNEAKEYGKATIWKKRADVKELPIRRQILQTTKVKTLWNIEREVSIYEFYYPIPISFNSNTSKQVKSLRDIGPIGNYVIEGTAGQGKSIFLRFLCGQELTDEHTSELIPVFIELRRITQSTGVPQLVLEALEKLRLPNSDESWRFFAASGKFALLLDAFDEVDPNLTERTIGEIEHLADLYRDNLLIVVTSRPESDIQKSARFRVMKLAKLSEQDHEPFLRKICTDREQSRNLIKVITASQGEVASLLTTPLMLTLLVILYKAVQTIPDSIPRFYEELFDVLFYRHDHSKPGFRRKRFTTLDDTSVKRLFAAFCFYARVQDYSLLTEQQFVDCTAKAASACNISVDPKTFKSELTKTICLMQNDGLETSFIHRSVAQYYAASFVSRSGDGLAQPFYEHIQAKHGWDLETRFLQEIDSYRFAKHFTMPCIEKICKLCELESVYDSNAEKAIDEYLSRTVTFIVGEVREAGSVVKDRITLVGWKIANDLTSPLAISLTHRWIIPMFTAIRDSHIDIPAHNHAEISISDALKSNIGVAMAEGKAIGASHAADFLKAEHRRAAAVIAAESRKFEIFIPLIS
jgi:NACHT domain